MHDKPSVKLLRAKDINKSANQVPWGSKQDKVAYLKLLFCHCLNVQFRQVLGGKLNVTLTSFGDIDWILSSTLYGRKTSFVMAKKRTSALVWYVHLSLPGALGRILFKYAVLCVCMKFPIIFISRHGGKEIFGLNAQYTELQTWSGPL